MTIGTSLFLIAIGAILKFAITLHVHGFDLQTAGVVLMVVGTIGLILGLWLVAAKRTVPPPPPPEAF